MQSTIIATTITIILVLEAPLFPVLFITTPPLSIISFIIYFAIFKTYLCVLN